MGTELIISPQGTPETSDNRIIEWELINQIFTNQNANKKKIKTDQTPRLHTEPHTHVTNYILAPTWSYLKKKQCLQSAVKYI